MIAIIRTNQRLLVDCHGPPIALGRWREQLSRKSDSNTTPKEVLAYLTGKSNYGYLEARFQGSPKDVVLIDNTSSQQWADSYPSFVAEGISIVTPNKKAFSGSQELWDRFSTHPRLESPFVYHEPTVGAGLPIISTLKDLVDTGDKIKRIEGVVSGSLSFLFNNFMPLSPSASDPSSSEPWSVHVGKARELGYTEPDPRDDLSGLDVARKIVILARVAGLDVEDGTESFPIESLIPTGLKNVENAAEFLERLPDFDENMEDMKRKARDKGKVLRYVGCVDVEKKELKVGLEWLDSDSPMAGLKGSDNVFAFWTERYEDKPLVIRGAG